ncbi:MAG: hypothetical protein AAGD47_07815 [Pseudomonadota bacterium]
MTYGIFYLTAFLGLGALCYVLLFVGRAASQCPQSTAAARLASVVVTTGFAAIGAGAIAIVGAALPAVSIANTEPLSMTIGITAIGLGIGFWNAASLLRDLVKEADRAAQQAVS